MQNLRVTVSSLSVPVTKQAGGPGTVTAHLDDVLDSHYLTGVQCWNLLAQSKAVLTDDAATHGAICDDMDPATPVQ